MKAGEWFRIAADAPVRAGQWHMAGWMHTAIKGEDLSIPGGATDRTGGWLSLAVCPRCHALVIADDNHAYGDQTWGHEDWHHRTDHPRPGVMSDEQRIRALVARLDAIHASGHEAESHIEADAILCEAVHPEIAAAYLRVKGRAGDWWYE